MFCGHGKVELMQCKKIWEITLPSFKKKSDLRECLEKKKIKEFFLEGYDWSWGKRLRFFWNIFLSAAVQDGIYYYFISLRPLFTIEVSKIIQRFNDFFITPLSTTIYDFGEETLTSVNEMY